MNIEKLKNQGTWGNYEPYNPLRTKDNKPTSSASVRGLLYGEYGKESSWLFRKVYQSASAFISAKYWKGGWFTPKNSGSNTNLGSTHTIIRVTNSKEANIATSKIPDQPSISTLENIESPTKLPSSNLIDTELDRSSIQETPTENQPNQPTAIDSDYNASTNLKLDQQKDQLASEEATNKIPDEPLISNLENIESPTKLLSSNLIDTELDRSSIQEPPTENQPNQPTEIDTDHDESAKLNLDQQKGQLSSADASDDSVRLELTKEQKKTNAHAEAAYWNKRAGKERESPEIADSVDQHKILTPADEENRIKLKKEATVQAAIEIKAESNAATNLYFAVKESHLKGEPLPPQQQTKQKIEEEGGSPKRNLTDSMKEAAKINVAHKVLDERNAALEAYKKKKAEDAAKKAAKSSNNK